jgi:hypothetical protein
MSRLWKLFLAHLHWSDKAVCEMSVGRGPLNDFHDWTDGTGLGTPIHFHTYRCSRCGKEFQI